MILIKILLRCDKPGCPTEMSVRAPAALDQMEPEAIKKAVDDMMKEVQFGIVEVNGKRQHICRHCWKEEFAG